VLTTIITSFAREWRKMAFFFNSRFLYRIGTTTYYWPRQGKTKGSTFKTFFSISDAVRQFLNGPFDIPKQIPKPSKGLRTVRNDMFIRMAEPLLLVKISK